MMSQPNSSLSRYFTFIQIFLVSLFFLIGCQSDPIETKEKHKLASEEIKMVALPSEQTNILFNNELDPLKVKPSQYYINVYNGGGVAIGDINGDDLADVYFTGNTVGNQLYLNKGDLKFQNITTLSGVGLEDSWSTGATMADVNNDGHLDIYVCLSYQDDPKKKENKLFINDGAGSFTEMGAQYGVNDSGYSIDAVFFDFDKDNDLDLYVANHPKHQSGLTMEEHYQNWLNPLEEYSDRLYRNNNDGSFTDVTKEAGVFNYGSTLSVSVSDFNDDDWPDMYVSVDHNEPDVLYENNKDGTFSKTIKKRFKHTAFSAMGSDAADFNNDGLIDFVSVDMLSEDNFRQKAQMGDMNPGLYWSNIDKGYNHTIMRNQLHLNNGNGTYSEIAALAGISKTDWSWAPLFLDLNNNGYKDLFVSNGYLLDILDKDFRKKALASLEAVTQNKQNPVQVLLDKVKDMSSTKLRNFCFQNTGNLKFKDISEASGLGFEGYSNGAAYGDLDNDGDLDMIVNNINDKALLYENKANETGNSYLVVELNGENKIEEYGIRVYVESDLGIQVQELQPTRGYQSSMHSILHFGLGVNNEIPKIRIEWPDGKKQTLVDVNVNQKLKVNYSDAMESVKEDKSDKMLFTKLREGESVQWKHNENNFDDYKAQVLLPHKMSQFGPHMSGGDVNGDQLLDVYVGGAAGQPGVLMLGSVNGKFVPMEQKDFIVDAQHEDLGSVFFDVDGDGDMDLYVVSGGNSKPEGHEIYEDRLYINDGLGGFSKSTYKPNKAISGSCVKASDFDKDGDIDLFVGGRHQPWKYPYPTSSYIVVNENGKLNILGEKLTPALKDMGMVTDAIWTDVNNDKLLDLIVVGEWMPISIIIQEDGKFVNHTENYGLSNTVGWWNTIEKGDLNGDGVHEFVLGNLGENYKYVASEDEPFHVYANDFDNSGTIDVALGYIYNDQIYPVRGRQCSSEQVPVIAEKFPNYHAFANATIDQVYGEELNSALHYQINTFKSSVLNFNDGEFSLKELPIEAQLAPINAIILEDFNNDGFDDILAAGNLFVSEVETGRADAGTGYVFLGSGDGTLTQQSVSKSGIYVDGDVKDLLYLKNKSGKNLLLVANNNEELECFELR